MIEKYGKDVDFLSLGRDLNYMRKMALLESNRCKQILTNEVDNVKKCPICKSESFSELEKIYGFIYDKCSCCGHVFVENIPSDISNIYSQGSEIQSLTYVGDDIFHQRIQTISKDKVKFITDVITSEKAFGGLWVDLGCGNGEILYEANSNGWNSVGFDADPNEIKFAQKNGLSAHKIYVDMLALDEAIIHQLKNAKVVSLFNVIEHVKDPCLWIETLSSYMEKGAYLVIDTPREPSLTRVMNIACLAYNYKHLIPPEHINIFTENSIDIMAKQNSLEWVAKWCFGSGFLDLFYSTLLLSDNEKFLKEDFNLAYFDDILKASNHIQKAVDESGLSNAMICVFKKI